MTSPRDEAILAAANLQISDRAPSTEVLEELQLRHEQLVEAKRKERWRGQERWQGRENEEMRLVRLMHPHQVFRHLRGAGVDARIESPVVREWIIGKDGKPAEHRIVRNTGRLWFNEGVKLGRIGVNAWVKDEITGEPTMRTVTTLQDGCGPEWSLMRFNEFGVVTAEKYRGWRTAMLHLIRANVLTEAEVDKAFGRPTLGPASQFYREQLQQFRMRKVGLIQ